MVPPPNIYRQSSCQTLVSCRILQMICRLLWVQLDPFTPRTPQNQILCGAKKPIPIKPHAAFRSEDVRDLTLLTQTVKQTCSRQ